MLQSLQKEDAEMVICTKAPDPPWVPVCPVSWHRASWAPCSSAFMPSGFGHTLHRPGMAFLGKKRAVNAG